MKQTILFLRNGQLFASKEAALNGLKTAAHKAGQPVVAIYSEEEAVKLIFAIGTAEGKYEIMATDADLNAVNTDVDGRIEDAIEAALNTLKGEGFDAANLAALEDSVDANTAALVKLNGADTEEGSVAKAVKEAKEAAIAAAAADAQAKIEALDVEKIAEEGKYIVSVSEADGKISAELKQIEAKEVKIEDANSHFTGETVEAALEELYTSAGAGSKVTMTSEAGTGDIATVYKFYQGGEDADHKIGEINIGKELMVKEGVVEEDENGVPHLKLTINDEAGTVVDIDLTKVLDVYTAGNGISVDSNEISVKKATDSEDFLVVDANGVAVKGVQDAINTAKGEAIADAKTETENQVKAAKDAIDSYTVNGIAISTNPVLTGDNVNYAEGTTLNTKIDAVNQAVEDLAGVVEDEIVPELGKVKVDANDATSGYLVDKIVSGTADEADNTYAATVAKNADGVLAITVKIDTIDGGTY